MREKRFGNNLPEAHVAHFFPTTVALHGHTPSLLPLMSYLIQCNICVRIHSNFQQNR